MASAVVPAAKYRVEWLLDVRSAGRSGTGQATCDSEVVAARREFLVRWAGYGAEHASWEPEEALLAGVPPWRAKSRWVRQSSLSGAARQLLGACIMLRIMWVTWFLSCGILWQCQGDTTREGHAAIARHDRG